MKVLGVIPVRLNSTRIPQKPLYKIKGKELVLHVYDKIKDYPGFSDLVVACDSVKVKRLIESHGGKAIITSSKHKNGTERLTEIRNLLPSYDCYCLVNGDEILVNPESITKSINSFKSNDWADVTILAVPYSKEHSYSDFKVVLDINDRVMYISRNDIPSSSRNSVGARLKAYHIMCFSKKALDAYRNLDRSPLESIEDHELLRLIENGFNIHCTVVHEECVSFDTMEDLNYILERL